MRDLKLSEVKGIDKNHPVVNLQLGCYECEFYNEEEGCEFNLSYYPTTRNIDESQPNNNTIEILRKFFNNHKEFRIVKNNKEDKFGLKLTNDYAGVKDYNFSGEKKDFELECFVHNISEDLFNALKEIGIYVEEESK